MSTLTTDYNRRYVLRQRPPGRIDADTFELTEAPVPEIGDGEALMRVDWMSLDPTNRAWIRDTPTYLPPVGIGDLMRGWGLGRMTLQGFVLLDNFDRMGEATAEIAGLIAQGRLTPLETVVDGFEQLPSAINMLFDGKNVGKLVVRMAR